MPFGKNQDRCHGSHIGNQNRIIRAILSIHVALIPPTKLRINLTYGWEDMVFGEYQVGYNGSHIRCPNGIMIALHITILFVI